MHNYDFNDYDIELNHRDSTIYATRNKINRHHSAKPFSVTTHHLTEEHWLYTKPTHVAPVCIKYGSEKLRTSSTETATHGYSQSHRYHNNRVTTLQTMWNSLTIPWRFLALVRGTRHVTCYSYHALNTCMYANMQRTRNNILGNFSLTRFFSLALPWLLAKNPWHFPDTCQIPWHFQVFQTSGHPTITQQTWNYRSTSDEKFSCCRVTMRRFEMLM